MSAPVATVLERILSETRQELERRKRELPLAQLRRAHGQDTRGGRLRDALNAPGIGVIAEFKRRSPSAGALHDAPDLASIVNAYEQGGAVAVSVLTEGPNFAGALEDLRTASAACALPLLRKDFIVDPYQLYEAQAAGAAAVLLIVAALERPTLESLHAQAHTLGLDVLVEVHDRAELDVALHAGAEIVGVNNRDLRDFSVDLQRTESLVAHVPSGVLVVSESGISRAAQLRRLHELGVRGVLVGATLMRSEDPAAALRELRSFRHSSDDI